MRRPTLRYPVEIMLQIAIQRSNNLPELSPQPVEESTDLLMEYRQVTGLMTLGTMILILMSVITCKVIRIGKCVQPVTSKARQR